MANNGLTNEELVEVLGLPKTIIDDLKTAQGTQFQVVANEFLDKLFNKVIYQTVASVSFENPFKKYDSFPIAYGSTIENVFVELPKGYKYDKDATDPFTRKIPDVETLYATINYEMQYETTIYDAQLRKAVLSEYGFMTMIDNILSSLQKSKSIDEYFATIAMLNNKDIMANGYENVDIPKDSTDETKAKILAKKIVDTAGSMRMPLKTNNKLKVLQVSGKDDLLLIIKRNVLDTINLDYLTGVFNLQKVDLIKNIIEVETFQTTQDVNGVESVVGDDIDFMIIDTKGFDNHVALEDGGMIYNPKGKYTNHFYNLWKIISFKYFYNARAFKINQLTQ